MTYDAKKLTICHAQFEQPWAQPYGQYKHHVVSDEGQLKHAVLHAQKSLGRIATSLEALDHKEQSWLSDVDCDAIADCAADLVSAALRIGNKISRSIAHALVRRVKEKNGNGYGEKLPSAQRAFGAMICK